MAEIIKISSSTNIKSNIQNLNRQIAPDALFDLTNPLGAVKPRQQAETDQKGTTQEGLLRDLNKAILEPLMTATGTQSGKLRELLLLSQLFEVSWGKIDESVKQQLFVEPEGLAAELEKRDQSATIFRGDVFDSLRMLAGVKGQPQLTNAIANLLKYFDCYVNQNSSLKMISAQAQNLASQLPPKAAALLTELNTKLVDLIQKAEADIPILSQSETDELTVEIQIKRNSVTPQKELQGFLKDEFIPQLTVLARKYPGSSWLRNSVLDLIHHVVRYDKADLVNLDDAAFQLGDVLKTLTSINDEGVEELKTLLLQTAIEETGKAAMKASGEESETDVAKVLSLALESGSPDKVNRVAHTLLSYLIQNESPVLPFVYFMVPIRFMDENVFGEFLIDRECKGRRGDAKQATNIFFTIQSDEFGDFEVDLLARDKSVDLDIKCPEELLGFIKEVRPGLRNLVEEQGYKLNGYRVGLFQAGRTIMQRFPELSQRKVGIDVKI